MFAVRRHIELVSVPQLEHCFGAWFCGFRVRDDDEYDEETNRRLTTSGRTRLTPVEEDCIKSGDIQREGGCEEEVEAIVEHPEIRWSEI